MSGLTRTCAATRILSSFPGDCIGDGQHWITLDSWMPVQRVATARRSSAGSGIGLLGDITLFVHSLTAATSFAEAVLTDREIPLAEIEMTKIEGTKEFRYLLIRVQNVIVTSVTRTLPPNQQVSTLGQRVEIVYDRINWTYTPVPPLPYPSQLISLRWA